jgi:hypothetical protein
MVSPKGIPTLQKWFSSLYPVAGLRLYCVAAYPLYSLAETIEFGM